MLEEKIRKNRDLLDGAEPPEGHLERFQSKLAGLHVGDTRQSIRHSGRFFRVAAVIAVLLGLSITYYLIDPSMNTNRVAASILPQEIHASSGPQTENGLHTRRLLVPTLRSRSPSPASPPTCSVRVATIYRSFLITFGGSWTVRRSRSCIPSTPMAMAVACTARSGSRPLMALMARSLCSRRNRMRSSTTWRGRRTERRSLIDPRGSARVSRPEPP